MNALTAVRIALYANLVFIFLTPWPLLVAPLAAQVGLFAASFYLRRRRRVLA